MIKNMESRSRQKIDKPNQRLLQKKRQTQKKRATEANEPQKTTKTLIEKYHQQVPQNHRIHKIKHLKPRKIKFITQEIQKSTHFLSPPLDLKRNSVSSKFSQQQRDFENAYELIKTFKKVKKVEQTSKRPKMETEQVDGEPTSYRLTHLSKIRVRPSKSNSNSHCSTVGDKSRFNGSNGKNRILPKTFSKSKQSLQDNQKHFLNPDIAQQEDSYYFDSPNQQRHHSIDSKKVPENLLNPKKLHVLFDSNGSVWKENIRRCILRSTLDLLN